MDGSKKKNSISNRAGMYRNKKRWEEEGFSINKIATIYMTVCIAMSKDIRMVEEKYRNATDEIIILTDSESALRGLLGISSDKPPNSWIIRIARQILNINVNGDRRIIFAWISALMGIESNETADSIVKERTGCDPDDSIKIPTEDINNHIKDNR